MVIVIRAVAALAICIAAGGCGSNPHAQADQLRQDAGSWAATLRFVTEEWWRGAVPAHFVQSTAHRARSALDTQARSVRRSLGEASSAPADDVLASLTPLRAAIERGDRVAALTLVRALSAAVPSTPTPSVARPR